MRRTIEGRVGLVAHGSEGMVGRRLRALLDGGAVGDLTDGQLLERFATDRGEGADAAFAALVERHGAMVLRVARGVLSDPHEAEDAFQATFLVLVARARGLWVRESLGPWLHQVALRTARCLRSNAARRRRLDRRVAVADGTAPIDDTDRDRDRALHEEIDRLPEGLRASVVLCDLEGRTHEQAARALGWPVGTVKSRQSRARDRLRDRLGRRGFAPGSAVAFIRPVLTPPPLPLLHRTTAAAVRSTSRAIVPGTAAALAREVTRSMILLRIGRAASLALLLTAAAATGSTLLARGHAPDPTPPPPPPSAEARQAPPPTPTGLALVGTVVDEADHPVPGATLGGTLWGKPVQATADVAGAFQFDPPPGVRPDDRPAQGLVLARDAAGRLGAVALARGERGAVRVVLKPARDLAVAVRDSEGRPVAGADVVVLEWTETVTRGRTDAQGRWSDRVPVDLEQWWVLARRDGVGVDYANGLVPGQSPIKTVMPAELALRLDGVDLVRLRVVDPAGRPLSGVRVGPWMIQKPDHPDYVNLSGMSEDWPTTDADGLVAFDWLPARPLHPHSFLTVLDGYCTPDASIDVSVDRPPGAVAITMTPLERVTGRVTGRDGRPGAGAMIRLQGQGAAMNGSSHFARTGADGRYEARVKPEQSYILTATLGDRAAPYRTGVVVRAGRPVANIDFVLGRATKVRGRVTIGPDDRPATRDWVNLIIRAGSIPPSLVRPGDTMSHEVDMALGTATDESGRYEFTVGPGDYTVQKLPEIQPIPVSIPEIDPPAEIVVDLKMPRPEVGPFAATVVDAEGRPVAGAIVDGTYASYQARRWLSPITADEQGSIQTERSLDPLMLHAASPDGRLGAIVRSEAEATEARIVVGPVASAAGTLLDPTGQPLAGRKLNYGIRIPMSQEPNAAFTDALGGSTATDAAGRFTLPSLVPGQQYFVMFPIGDDGQLRHITDLTVAGPGPIALGEIRVDDPARR